MNKVIILALEDDTMPMYAVMAQIGESTSTLKGNFDLLCRIFGVTSGLSADLVSNMCNTGEIILKVRAKHITYTFNLSTYN